MIRSKATEQTSLSLLSGTALRNPKLKNKIWNVRHHNPPFPLLQLISIIQFSPIKRIVPIRIKQSCSRISQHITNTKDFDMEINVENENESSPQTNEEHEPLLLNKDLPPQVERNLIQQAISQTFASTAHLANLLPTGSVLAFQLLSPIFSNQGHCDSVSRSLTGGLIPLCGLSCILLSFTDSFKDQKGNICYGFATFRGLWIIDGSVTVQPEIAAKYKLKFIDFVHALMSILVFAAIALFNENVVNCFYPEPSTGTKEVLTSLPVGIGVVCSMLFVVFPTKRHGIGFPVTDS